MPRIDRCSGKGSLLYLKHQAAKTECCITHRRDGLETMHVIHVGMGGNRKKPNPRHFTALRAHWEVHSNHHSMTSEEFYRRYGINLWEAVGRQLAAYFEVVIDYGVTIQDWEGFACNLLERSRYNGKRRIIEEDV